MKTLPSPSTASPVKHAPAPTSAKWSGAWPGVGTAMNGPKRAPSASVRSACPRPAAGGARREHLLDWAFGLPGGAHERGVRREVLTAATLVHTLRDQPARAALARRRQRAPELAAVRGDPTVGRVGEVRGGPRERRKGT